MLYWIWTLQTQDSALRIFQYITVRAALAAVLALVFSLSVAPLVIKILKKRNVGENIRNDGPKTHSKKAGTPTMGGIIIIGAAFFAVLLCANLTNDFVVIATLVMLAFSILGFIDDYLKLTHPSKKGMNAAVKFGGQIFIATGVAVFLYFTPDFNIIPPPDVHIDITRINNSTLFIPFFKHFFVNLGLLYIPFAMLFITGWSNAVNLTDGLDGLASGLGIFSFLAFAGFAYIIGSTRFSSYLLFNHITTLHGPVSELTVVCMALVGAQLGFLWYNSHPAQIFMGDTGALALGGTLGIVALLIKQELILFIVGGVFFAETASVALQVVYFKLTKKRLFKMAPLHHHFELCGWDESKVVVRFWIIGAICALIGLATLKLR